MQNQTTCPHRQVFFCPVKIFTGQKKAHQKAGFLKLLKHILTAKGSFTVEVEGVKVIEEGSLILDGIAYSSAFLKEDKTPLRSLQDFFSKVKIVDLSIDQVLVMFGTIFTVSVLDKLIFD